MRLLVVEDEASMADSLRRGLEAEGYVLEVSSDGADALWRASEFGYDAMVLDIMLPGLSGFVVARRLREAGRDVPILMLTAKNGDLDHAEALDTGADDFLTKPFSFPVLLARLRALIRRGSTIQTSVLKVDDLELDLVTRLCRRGDTEIDLTPRELALASYLIVNTGKIVSRQQLLRHVWGADDIDDTNIVDVYVGYLRRKIDAPFDTTTIETVRGVGYRIADRGT